MFRLLRYFSFTSALALATVTIIHVILYHQNEVNELVTLAETQNLALAQSFANTIWPQYADYVTSVGHLDGDSLRARPETKRLHETLRSLSAGLPVLKVKIYHLDGNTVFSTDPDEIGVEGDHDMDLWDKARAGSPESDLSFSNTMQSFDGLIENRTVVESYLPIRRVGGPVESVFELYSDVTHLIDRIVQNTVRLMAELVAVFSLLYLVLFLIVRRADRILKRQYSILKESEESINAKNLALEREIADRRQAEEKVRDLAEVHEQNPNPVLRVLSGGRLLYANRASAPILDHWNSTVDGNVPDDWRQIFDEVLDSMHMRNMEITLGSLFFSMTIVPVTKLGCVNVHARDITQRRAAETEVRRLNVELEQRVRRRTASLEAANREIEAFAYSVSHDLRAPLRHINGFTRSLVEDYAEVLDADGKHRLERVHAASNKMGQLIDDLLDMSRSTRGEMERENVNLSTLARSVVGQLRDAQPDREVDVEIAPDVIAEGDVRLLRVAMDNLLGNSWKYTGRTENPRIEFGITNLDEQPVYFVADNGAGFDMAMADNLFAPFYRLHPAEEFDGTGIGLATVQRIIHRHGGEIWAKAEAGKGAKFYFTL